MEKKVKYSLTLWLIIAFVVALILNLVLGVIFDKSDWIFLVLIVGLIVINVKLNKLLSKDKK